MTAKWKWIPLISGALVVLLAGQTRLQAAEAHDDLRDYLKKEMHELGIPGMQVAVVRHQKIVFLAALGIAEVGNAVPVNNKTVFPIASATKAFTGVALMQLVENGKLELAAPISRYIDGLPVSWQRVTIRQLAAHISGLPNIVNNDTGELVTGVQIAAVGESDVDAAWSKVQALPIEFSPGEKYSYNQTNYILLGKVIDKLSGQPFTQFIKEQQLDPAGMRSTVYADDSEVVPHRARSYSNIRFNKDGQMEHRSNLTEQYVRFPPQFLTAAGLTTNAEDLAHWIIALERHRLLKQESSLTALWTPSILNDGKNGTWGLGWPLFARPKHSSYVPFGGAKAAFAVYPEDDVAVVILTNLQGSMPERFIDRVAAYYIPGFPE
ncbi:MAG TPA: serine hydrolase domain-containing protein [Steroidobacteraceae bacterium]|nr:serine hydrolase domain-containing protein [Steroidobacteraceae bacterium]